MSLIQTELPFKSWLKSYGDVFKIIDDHDSGNISYGVTTKNEEKHFIKFAPATNKSAIKLLNNAYEIGTNIKHPVLTKFYFAIRCMDGLAVVYNWVEAESINEVTNANKSNIREFRKHISSPYSRLKALPVDKIILILNKIFDLHVLVEEEGYVSCDWYDGCLMYNFNTDNLFIMDLDIYNKGSFTNTMGRMYGSSRFMAPEEFELGAEIDTKTTVYHMGATVFELLGKGKKNLQEGFRGTEQQFQVALKAISDKKIDRYQSVKDFYTDWIKTI